MPEPPWLRCGLAIFTKPDRPSAEADMLRLRFYSPGEGSAESIERGNFSASSAPCCAVEQAMTPWLRGCPAGCCVMPSSRGPSPGTRWSSILRQCGPGLLRLWPVRCLACRRWCRLGWESTAGTSWIPKPCFGTHPGARTAGASLLVAPPANPALIWPGTGADAAPDPALKHCRSAAG